MARNDENFNRQPAWSDTASCLSLLTYSWMTPLLVLGKQRQDIGQPLELSDLSELPEEQRVDINEKLVSQAWEEEMVKNQSAVKKASPSIASALLSAYFTQSMLLLLISMLPQAAVLGQAFLLRGFTTWLISAVVYQSVSLTTNNHNSSGWWVNTSAPTSFPEPVARQPDWEGYAWGFGVIALGIFRSFASSHVAWQFRLLTMAGVGGLRGLIFRSALNLPCSHGMTGRVVTAHSGDVERASNVFLIYQLLIQVIVLIGASATLVIFVGWAGLLIVGFFILISPLQLGLMMGFVRSMKATAAKKDDRVAVLTELLQGIRVCKFMSWEGPFTRRIDSIRNEELDCLRRSSLFRGAVAVVMQSLPTVSSFALFASLHALSGRLSPSEVFPSLVVFNILREAVASLPRSATAIQDAFVCCSRINDVLLAANHNQSYLRHEFSHQEREPNDGKMESQSYPCEDLGQVDDKEDWHVELANVTVLGTSNSKAKGQTQKAGTDKSDEGQDISTSKKTKPDGACADTIAEKKSESEHSPPSVVLLSNVNVRVPRGKLTVIIGPTSAGKSTLLSAILGEAKLTSDSSVAHHHCLGHQVSSVLPGEVKETDSKEDAELLPVPPVAFVPQDAWIMNASVKANITLDLDRQQQTPFGNVKAVAAEASNSNGQSPPANEPFFSPSENPSSFTSDSQRRRYEQVLCQCQLLPDLAQLQQGDQTEIGERGITLSGGQKHRVALARAAFSDAKLVLLDDPLSAVDAHVGSALVHECILPMVREEGRTCILVTHQTQYLMLADFVIAMEPYHQHRKTTSEKVVESNGITIADAVGNDQELQQDTDDSPAPQCCVVFSGTRDTFLQSRFNQSRSPNTSPKSNSPVSKTPTNKNSITTSSKQKLLEARLGTKEKDNEEGGRLMTKELSKLGGVDGATYFWFVKSGGRCTLLGVVLACVLWQCAQVMYNLTLAFWSSGEDTLGPFVVKGSEFIQIMAVCVSVVIIAMGLRETFRARFSLSTAAASRRVGENGAASTNLFLRHHSVGKNFKSLFSRHEHHRRGDARDGHSCVERPESVHWHDRNRRFECSICTGPRPCLSTDHDTPCAALRCHGSFVEAIIECQ